MNTEPTLTCVTNSEEVCTACHTDCGPFWSDDFINEQTDTINMC